MVTDSLTANNGYIVIILFIAGLASKHGQMAFLFSKNHGHDSLNLVLTMGRLSMHLQWFSCDIDSYLRSSSSMRILPCCLICLECHLAGSNVPLVRQTNLVAACSQVRCFSRMVIVSYFERSDVYFQRSTSANSKL